jgi:hypothetical protein
MQTSPSPEKVIQRLRLELDKWQSSNKTGKFNFEFNFMSGKLMSAFVDYREPIK